MKKMVFVFLLLLCSCGSHKKTTVVTTISPIIAEINNLSSFDKVNALTIKYEKKVEDVIKERSTLSYNISDTYIFNEFENVHEKKTTYMFFNNDIYYKLEEYVDFNNQVNNYKRKSIIEYNDISEYLNTANTTNVFEIETGWFINITKEEENNRIIYKGNYIDDKDEGTFKTTCLNNYIEKLEIITDNKEEKHLILLSCDQVIPNLNEYQLIS